MEDARVAESGWPGAFGALGLAGFRLFWFGTLAAISGSWLQITTLNWLIYRLTDSPLMLGLTNFVSVLPVGLLSLFAGVISDHVAPRRLLFLMRGLRALAALVLAGLVLTELIQVWHIMVVLFVGAATDTLELPTRYVFLTHFVEEKDLPNAIALNATALTLGRIVGPAVAGILVGWVSEGISFLVACAFNLVFVVCLLAMQPRVWTRSQEKLHLTKSLLDGLRYVWQDQNVKGLLILLAAFSFLGGQHLVLMPVFARDVLQSDAQGYGLLMSISGVSSLIGTLLVASLKAGRRGQWLMAAGAMFALSLMLFSVSRWMPLSSGILLLVGVSQIVLNVLGRAMSQMLTPQALRGRVAGFFALFNNGLTRLGGLQAGVLSQYVSAPFALQVGGAMLLVCLLLITWRVPSVRRLS
jgi:predicted MFS family arabinose efflux permease